MITIAVICGADDFVAITQFGYLKLSGHDTTHLSECAQKKGRVASTRLETRASQQIKTIVAFQFDIAVWTAFWVDESTP
jgi:hypothetical protein